MNSQDSTPDPHPVADFTTRLVSEGVVLAVIPVLGYAFAFAFEAGYMFRFGVPVWAVEVDASHLLVALAVLFTSFAFVLNVLYIVPARPWHALFMLLLPSAILALFVIWVFAATDWTWGRHLLLPVILIALFAAMAVSWIRTFVLRPAQRRPEGTTVWSAWVAEMSEVYQRDYVSVFDRLAGYFGGRRASLTFALALLLAISIHGFGSRQAGRQAEFAYVPEHGCVAVRRYHDHVVCVSVDTARKSVLPAFRLLSATANDRQLDVLRLGRLSFPGDSAGIRKFFTLNQQPEP